MERLLLLIFRPPPLWIFYDFFMTCNVCRYCEETGDFLCETTGQPYMTRHLIFFVRFFYRTSRILDLVSDISRISPCKIANSCVPFIISILNLALFPSKLPDPGLQIRQIPDPENPIGDSRETQFNWAQNAWKHIIVISCTATWIVYFF